MKDTNKIPRVIFNFNDKCIYGCGFCFTPFDNKGLGTIEVWENILKRIDDLSPDLISFSGCDPFSYNQFYDLLLSYNKRCYINIDSALIEFNVSKFDKIASKIDSISFPIDDSETMQAKQRFTKTQYEIIFKNISLIKKYDINLTAHTLLTPLNIKYVDELALRLIKLGVKNWTIYQFWEYDFILSPDRYFLSDNDYLNCCCMLKDKFSDKINIKYELQKERTDCKFFVSSLGNCYTSGNKGNHIQIGSIFEENIVEKWKKHCDIIKSQNETIKKICRECKRGNI